MAKTRCEAFSFVPWASGLNQTKKVKSSGGQSVFQFGEEWSENEEDFFPAEQTRRSHAFCFRTEKSEGKKKKKNIYIYIYLYIYVGGTYGNFF